MTKLRLGAFLTTFERVNCLEVWLLSLKRQSVQPDQIFILDNSNSHQVFSFFQNKEYDFHRVGYNSGPAGTAALGLKKLEGFGFDWIYWGDDDDPPTDPKTFERLLEIATSSPKIGVVGKVGGKFNPLTGRTRVLDNSELSSEVEADYVPGNKHILVSSKVVQAGILPDPKLFFGFEELEFCLRVKDAGFSILVDGQGMIDARNKAGNIKDSYRWKGKSLGDPTRINRHYYSLRNMLYILWSRGHYLGYGYFLLKALLKIPLSIRYGLTYFEKFSKLSILAIYHQWTGRFGQFIPTR